MPATIAIIGAGPLGRWLALRAAQSGFRVLLEDVMPANLLHAQETLRRQLGPLALRQEAVPALQLAPQALHGRSEPQTVEEPAEPQALRLIEFVSTIEDAVREADLVIDCVPDEIESKLEIFFLLDRMAPPRAVLATPTTRQSIADLASCTYRPGQCIAIVSEASALAANAGSEVLLQITSKTLPATIALLDGFWRQLGFIPCFAPDPAEQGSMPL
jgi:3-hydroxybutyryl-CoA dehydrogenase